LFNRNAPSGRVCEKCGLEHQHYRDDPVGYCVVNLEDRHGHVVRVRFDVRGNSFEGVEYRVTLEPLTHEQTPVQQWCVEPEEGGEQILYVLSRGAIDLREPE